MTKPLKYIAIALTLAVAILVASFLSARVSSQAQIENALKPQVVELQSLLNRGLENGDPDLQYSVLAHTDTGEAELMNLTGFPKHYHERESHFLYILQGNGELQIGSLKTQIKPGDFVVIPAGKDYEHELKAIGDQPVQLLAFRTPPEL